MKAKTIYFINNKPYIFRKKCEKTSQFIFTNGDKYFTIKVGNISKYKIEEAV